MSFSYPIRPVADSELRAFAEVPDHAFNSNWPTDKLVELDRLVFEPERSLVAFDGDRMVGTTVAYSFGLSVPGGTVDAAGISGVGVLPTHRRRGILSALMRRQLADVAAGQEPVAALFASEAAIYGRYGYGSAADQYSFVIHRGEGSLRPVASAPAWPAEVAAQAVNAATSAVSVAPPSLRLAEPRDVIADMKAVYDRIRPTRPGMVTRHDGFWQLHTSDPEFMREGSSPMRCVIAEDSAGPRGYSVYSVKPDWGRDGMPAQALSVRELFWTDPAACAALWSDLLSRDLVKEVRARQRPIDDPLLHLLADPRRARARVTDGLWIRIVDLPTALLRRCYSSAVDVVIEVADDLLPGNGGRWRLQAGGPADGSKPTCERTSNAADIALPVSALGAAYLGGTRLGALASAGQVTEFTPGALAALSTAMWWDPAPWSPIMF